MSFSLSGLFHNLTGNQTDTVSQSAAANAASSDAARNYQIVNQILNLTAGETISGEIVSIDADSIQIMLDEHSILQAKLEQSMNLLVGQNIIFQVKANAGDTVALTPLYQNLSSDETVIKALNAAELPINDKSSVMVASMMDEGMPVDKTSLQAMYRQIIANPENSPISIVQMNRLQIPVTQSNIEQFESYKNYEHKLLGSLEDITNSMQNTFSQIQGESGNKEAFSFYGKILDAVFANIIDSAENETENGNIQKENVIKENVMPLNLNIENSAKEMTFIQVSGKETTVFDALSGALSEEIAEQSKNKEINSSATRQDAIKMADALNTLLEDVLPKENTGVNEKEILNTFNSHLQNGTKMDSTQALAKLLTEIRELLGQIQGDTTKAQAASEALQKFFGSDEWKNVMQNHLTKQLLITPEDVGKEREVEKLYDRINQQTQKLTAILSELEKGNTPLAKTVDNLQQNVDFMNRLNQMYTYVQLPLKMSQQNAHGELYVYTNKKNLAKKDGSVSALLHLDMDHLGSMDIYVAMQKSKVNTKFYLENEDIIDFMEVHMDILTDRLKQKGYTVSTEVMKKETTQETNIMEEILKTDKNASAMVVKYAFDARA